MDAAGAVADTAFEGCTAMARVVCKEPVLRHFLRSAAGPVLVRIPSAVAVDGWVATTPSFGDAATFARPVDRLRAGAMLLAMARSQFVIPFAGR